MAKPKPILHIYTRVSSTQQADQGTSLDHQRQLGVSKAKELGMRAELWNEGGQSSFYDDLTNRPVLLELLHQVETGSVQNLFVYNTDRLSRNQKTWGMIRYKLLENQVTLYTSSGKIELNNPIDDLLLGILSEISQYDSKLRTERSRQGRFMKIQKGFWRGGPPAFGYSVKDKMLIVNPREAKWIKFIFQRYLDTGSPKTIKIEMEQNGILTRRGNSNWTIGSIAKILRNTIYIGYYTYTDKQIDQTVRIQTPKIIDPLTFESVQLKIKQSGPNRESTKYQKHIYNLKGKLTCGHCGLTLGTRVNYRTKTKLYYCPKKERDWVNGNDNPIKWQRHQNCGLEKSLDVERTEGVLWKSILQILDQVSSEIENLAGQSDHIAEPIQEVVGLLSESVQEKIAFVKNRHHSSTLPSFTSQFIPSILTTYQKATNTHQLALSFKLPLDVSQLNLASGWLRMAVEAWNNCLGQNDDQSLNQDMTELFDDSGVIFCVARTGQMGVN